MLTKVPPNRGAYRETRGFDHLKNAAFVDFEEILRPGDRPGVTEKRQLCDHCGSYGAHETIRLMYHASADPLHHCRTETSAA